MRLERRHLIPVNRRERRARRARRAAECTGVGLALALACGIAAHPARGEEAREPTPGVEELEVRAPSNPYKVDRTSLSRLPGLLQDTPQSITVVPEALIEAQGATSLRDALRNVSGIGLNAGEGGAQGDDFTLRGYNAKNDIYVDGIRDAGSFFRDSFNLEAVEVFKGPTSTYFGRGSTGGVVNQVSKSPRLDPGYSGVVSLGDASFRRATFDVNQPVGDSTAVRVNAVGQYAELVDRDEVEVDRRGLAASFATGIGTPTQWTLSYLFQEEDNVPDYGLPYIDGRPARVSRETFFGDGDTDFEKTRVHVGTLRLDRELGDRASLRSTVRYSHTDRRAAPTAPRPCSPGQAACLGATAAGIRRNVPERDATESILSHQTDVTTRLRTGALRHTLTGGYEVSIERFSLTRFDNGGPFSIGLDPRAVDPAVPVPERSVRSRSLTTALATGLFVSDQIALSEQLDLVLGLRLDTFHARVESEPNTVPDLDQEDRALSHRIGLVYKPTPSQSYYASYGTSFNPSAESLTLRERDEGTDPEESRSFELGAKLSLLEGALDVQGALFRIEKTDAREVDPVSGLSELSGSNQVSGVEVGLIGRLIPGWTVFAGYTFLDAETEDALDPATEGNQLGRVPRHSATFWTQVSLMQDRLEIGGGPTYVSHRFSNDANTNRIDGYVRWDAAISYRLSENVQVRMNVQNLADRELFESTSGGHAVPAAGRTVVVSTAFAF